MNEWFSKGKYRRSVSLSTRLEIRCTKREWKTIRKHTRFTRKQFFLLLSFVCSLRRSHTHMMVLKRERIKHTRYTQTTSAQATHRWWWWSFFTNTNSGVFYLYFAHFFLSLHSYFVSHFRKQRPFQKHDYSDFVSETETKKESPGFTFTQNTHTKKHTSKCSLLSNSCMCRWCCANKCLYHHF